MSIRTRFWMIIFITSCFAGMLSFTAYRTSKKLETLTHTTQHLEQNLSNLTSFRAASRQSLLELTEYLYTRAPINRSEYEESRTEAGKFIKENFGLGQDAPDDELKTILEITSLHHQFNDKVAALFARQYPSHSRNEATERETIETLFHEQLLKKVNDRIQALNRNLDGVTKEYQVTVSDMASMTPRLAGALTLFVLFMLTIMGKSIANRFKLLDQAMSQFELGKTSSVPLPTKGKDEIAKIARSFAALTQRTQNTEKLLAEKQQQFVITSKLASLGEMSAGIAHEINNPLAIIAGAAELLPKYVNQPEKLAAKVDAIQRSCVRISKIVRGLKKFSRSAEKTDFASHSLHSIIEEVLVLTGAKSIRHSTPVSIETNTEARIYCNEVEMEQVMVNLINNAIDAVKSQPEKWVKTKIYEEGDTLVMRVMDSGPGIPMELQSKLFDPFFTTKKVGEGTGLGLSIAKGILDEHHATIGVVNDSPHTCFEIRFQKFTGVHHAA